jgi:hypothetical protein
VVQPDLPIRVECYAGGRGEEAPRRLLTGGRWEELTILRRWVSEDAQQGNRLRWFRVRLGGDKDGLVYQDEALDAWFWRAGP